MEGGREGGGVEGGGGELWTTSTFSFHFRFDLSCNKERSAGQHVLISACLY